MLNLGYRFTRNSLRQIDMSTQWPLSGRWHGVARWNYSLQDGRILEALGGLEYNQQLLDGAHGGATFCHGDTAGYPRVSLCSLN